MKYKVELSKRAKEDRERAYDWYAANYSDEFALRWFAGITQGIESLSQDPLRFPKALENDDLPFDLYELLFGTKKNKHRILFTIRGDVVFVVHIRHSAQRDLTEDDL